MILQTLTIASGALSFTKQLTQYEPKIGIALLAFALVGLLERFNILYIGLGSSFPQIIPLALSGFVLAAPLLTSYGPLGRVAQMLLPYRIPIAVVSILSGAGSLLFGCVLPLVCSVPF